MKRAHICILVTLLVACSLSIVEAAEKAEKTRTLTTGTFLVKVTNDHVSLQANEAPLAKILQEIGKQAGIPIDSNIGPEERITIQLDRVSLEEALNRLATNVTIYYAQVPNDNSRRISKVVVLGEGTRQAAPGKRAPAVRPTPFKFEFDPAQFMDKEKAPKKP